MRPIRNVCFALMDAELCQHFEDEHMAADVLDDPKGHAMSWYWSYCRPSECLERGTPLAAAGWADVPLFMVADRSSL